MSAVAAASSFVIRRATDADPLDALLALVHEAFAALAIDPPSSVLKETRADIAERVRSQSVFIAEAGGRIVGAVFCEQKADELYVGRLAVAPQWRRRGIARTLIETARSEARRLGAMRITLRVRIVLDDNVRLFQRCGFAIVGESAHSGYTHPTSYEMAMLHRSANSKFLEAALERGRRDNMAPAPKRYAKLRRRLFEILEHGPVGDVASHVVSYALVALIIVNLIAVTLDTVPDLAARYASLFLAIEIVSTAVFTIEYLLRLWVAAEHDDDGAHSGRARLAYARSLNGIVDLIAILPFWIGFFFFADLRAILVFRIFRFLKLVRYSVAVRSLLDALYLERRPLAGCVVIFLGTALLAASLMYLAEREAQPDKFGTIPQALWSRRSGRSVMATWFRSRSPAG